MSRRKYDGTDIDIYNLHTEWKNHSKVKQEALDEEADAKDELARKKTYYNYRSSQITLEYNIGKRTLLDVGGEPIKKPTVGALKSAVESDEELYKLEQELNVLQKAVNIATSYASAVSDRKYGLQDEVKLYLSSYFAEPVDFTRNSADYIKEVKEIKEKMDASEEREELKKRRKRRLEKDE